MPGFELIGEEEQKALNEIFEKKLPLSRLGRGALKTKEFEGEFAKKLRVKYAHALSSGTAALLCALKGLNIRPGDEVITQSFTFVATVEAIIEAGAIPVITEVNKTLNMDPKNLRAKITRKTKVIIPVHMMGAPAQMDEIMAIAKESNIPILEETAQALGGEYKQSKLGTIGDIGIFSFDFGKTLTTGEGGMIVSNNEEIYSRAKEFADHGHQNNPNLPRAKDTRRRAGFNFRMTELQAAIGLVQLRKLDEGVARQKENKKRIKEGIKNVTGIEFREFADEAGELGDSLIFFVEDRSKAEKFAQKLRENGLETKNIPSAIDWHFAGTWNHMLSHVDIYKDKDLKRLWEKSDDILSRAIAIPVNIKMDEEQINKVISTIIKISKEI